MSYTTVIYTTEKIIMGIPLRTDNEQASHDIPAHWKRFYDENIPAIIPHKKSDDIYAVYTDYEGDFTQPYTLIIGCEVTDVDNIPPGLALKTLSTGLYARFIAKGEWPQSVVKAWQHIWELDLERAYTTDVVCYPKDFADHKTANICIALK